MIIVHVNARVKPERIEEFQRATTENARNSVQEPGVARFDVVQQADDPARFVLVEVYRTADAVAAHKETRHYQAWRDAVAGMMAEPRSSVTMRRSQPAPPSPGRDRFMSSTPEVETTMPAQPSGVGTSPNSASPTNAPNTTSSLCSATDCEKEATWNAAATGLIVRPTGSPTEERLFATTAEGSVGIFDLRGGKPDVGVIPHGGPVERVETFPSPARWLSCGADGNVRLWSREGAEFRPVGDTHQLGKQIVDPLRFRHEGHWPHQSRHRQPVRRGQHEGQQVLGIQHAHDLIDRLAVHRHPRVPGRGDRRQDLGG